MLTQMFTQGLEIADMFNGAFIRGLIKRVLS